MVFGEKLIELLGLLDRDWPYNQMDQDLLLISSWLAETGEFLFHAPQPEKMQPGCPAKSFNPFLVRELLLRKNAP